MHNIELIKIIKNGLTNSIGWNLGKKNKSIHLLDPLTSIPINGTKIKNIKENKNYRRKVKSFWSIDDMAKIMIVPNKIKSNV